MYQNSDSLYVAVVKDEKRSLPFITEYVLFKYIIAISYYIHFRETSLFLFQQLMRFGNLDTKSFLFFWLPNVILQKF